MAAQAFQERFARILRLWRAAWKNPQRREILDTLSFQDTAGLVVAICLLILGIFHFELLVPKGFPGFAVPGILVAGLALVLPLAAWRNVIYLQVRWKSKGGIRPVWRLLLFLGGCVPLAGLYLWPLWRVLTVRRTERIFEPLRSSPVLTLKGQKPWRAQVERVSISAGIWQVLSLLVGLLSLPILWAFWMAGGPELGPERRTVLISLCVVFHLTAAVCIPYALEASRQRFDARSWQGIFLRLLPAIVLLGLPGAAIGIAAILFFGRILETRLLIPAVYQRGRDLRQGPLWLGLETALLEREARQASWFRPWARLRRPAPKMEGGQADDRWKLLCHLKAALTFPAALAFSWWALDSLPLTVGARAFWISLYATGSLAAVGIGIELILVCSNFLGENVLSRALASRPYGFFLLASQSAGLLGLLAGAALSWDQAKSVGGQLFSVGPVVAAVVALIALMRRGLKRDKEEALSFLFWISFTFVIVGAGAFMALSEDPGFWQYWILGIAVLVDLSLGLSLGGWLLRPFGMRQILDSSLPVRLRLALAFLGATALLPLGGLAILLWILIRHRWWPEWEGIRWQKTSPLPER